MDTLIKNLSAIVGSGNVLSKPDELLVYECDGLPHHKYRPRAVVFPSSTEQTSAVMKELACAHVPFTPRGAGTGLSGGALAMNSGVVIELARMRQIIRIDPVNQLAVVQPGVVNLQVSRAVAPYGLYYVPDPSSQPTCTIGGNIAEGAGGIHCLKYGTTTDHVLGCVAVLAGGEVVRLGGAGIESHGYDLLGTFIGSEGTFGVVTEATLRLVQIPPAVRTLLAEFGEVNDASHAVSAIIAAGVMPAALEMMDHEVIRAVEASTFAAGLPPDAGAALLIELDGIDSGLDEEVARVTDICMEFGARNCRAARDEAERKKLWAARKGAFGALGRIAPDSMIQDAVVPRSRLPEVLSSAYEIAHKYDLRLANVFHAGDGNLHPLICFDSRSADEVRRVKEAGRELMEVCVSAGGTITGEHGVGLDKRELLPLVFSDADMNAMLDVRMAFDPLGLCNPGKIVPMLRGCGEGRAVALDDVTEKDSEPVASYTHAQTTVIRKPQNTRTPFGADEKANYLAELFGESNVQVDGPTLVVYPGSVEEIQELTALAMGEGWTIMPAGNRTWLPTQTESSLVISTSRLDRIKEHEPADLIAIAEAGVTLQSFNEQLAKNGQWLPLDPPDNGTATLGGVVATGLGGTQQFAYGRPRASVIGMKVVLGGGTLIKAGGRVVKNVAGYDLCKLFSGSFGTLGIITEVTFKLRPKPAVEQTILVNGTINELIQKGRAIIESRLFPVGLELISSAVANKLRLQVSADHDVLLVRFAGNEKGVRFQTQQALDILGNSSEVIENDLSLWQELAALPLDSNQTSWRASVLPDRANQLLNNLSTIYKEGVNELKWQIGIADGRFRLMSDSKSSKEAKAAVEVLGGNFFVENPAVIVSSTSILMSRVKQQLDPYGTFGQIGEVQP